MWKLSFLARETIIIILHIIEAASVLNKFNNFSQHYKSKGKRKKKLEINNPIKRSSRRIFHQFKRESVCLRTTKIWDPAEKKCEHVFTIFQDTRVYIELEIEFEDRLILLDFSSWHFHHNHTHKNLLSFNKIAREGENVASARLPRSCMRKH